MQSPINTKTLSKSWRNKLGLRSHAFEKSARRSWQRKLDGQTEAKLKKELAHTQHIVLGDHRINTLQMIDWLALLDEVVSKKWVLLTDRFDQVQQDIINAFVQGKRSQNQMNEDLGLHTPLSQCPEGGLALVAQWLKKKKMTLAFIEPKGSFENQTKRLYRKLASYGDDDQVLVWTGSLKVAPIWYKKYYQAAHPCLLLNMDAGFVGTKRAKTWLNQEKFWLCTKHQPLVSLELTRLWQESEPFFVRPDQVKSFIQGCMAHMQQAMAVPEKKINFHLCTPFVEQVTKVLQKVDRKTMQFIRARLRKMESAVIPQHRLILVSRLDQGSLAEEAMHFLRLYKSRKQDYGPWVTIWEEAWGMFGSLLIDPSREIENKQTQAVWESVHLMGYALGKAMFEAWSQKSKRATIRQAFAWITEDEQEAEIFVEKMQILLWA